MASSSSSSLTNNNTKPSRYPSLKSSFKFMTKEKGTKPPPLPPKDSNYISNRILSPDTLSIPPNSPASPYHTQYSQRISPAPSQSSVSLVSSATSARSQTVDTSLSQRQSRLKAKASSLFTLVKRTTKSAKSPDPERPPSPQEDPGISTPWNFQVRFALRTLYGPQLTFDL